MKKIVTYLVLAFFLLSSGCERDLIIATPPHTPRLVLHAYIETGNNFEVIIGRSFGISDPIPTDSGFVTNATAILFENDIRRDTLDYDPATKRYGSTTVQAIAGNIYRLQVEAPGFTTVTAIARALPLIPTLDLTFSPGSRVNVDGQLLDDIRFSFQDPQAENNYYLTIISNYYSGSFCSYSYDPVVENYQDGLDPFESANCIRSDEILYKDQLFNGSVKQLQLSTSSGGLFTVEVNGNLRRPYIKRLHISGEYYRYLKAGFNLSVIEGNPFMQPATIQGNVENGFGLFAISGVSVDTLR